MDKRTLARAILIAVFSALPLQFARAADPVPLPDNDIRSTPVTIHARDASPGSLIDQLSKQSGCKLQLDFSPGASVNLDADEAPLLGVLCDLCDQSHIAISSGNYGDSAMHLSDGSFCSAGRRVVSGPVMAQFHSIERLSQLTAAPEDRDFCDLQAAVVWEPRLAIAMYQSFSTPSLAVDENGLSLVPPAPVKDPRNPAEESYPSPRQYNQTAISFEHSIRLKVPAAAGRRVAHIQGQFSLWVIDKTQSVTVADLKKAAKRRPTLRVDDKTQFDCDGIWSSDSMVQVQLQVKKSPGESPADWSQREAMLESTSAHVEGEDEQPWSVPARVQQSYDMGSGSKMFMLIMQRNGSSKTAAQKMILDVPESLKELDVPYDLKDLPLP